MNWLISTATIASIAYLGIVIGMYSYQRDLMYLPNSPVSIPAPIKLTGVEEIRFATTDGENLHAWYLAAKTGQPTILFFHGNAGSITERIERLAYYQTQGFGALYVSYRGYGKSTGKPTETGLVSDALASYDWLKQKGLMAKNIIVVGESLGAAVSVRLAVQREIKALIIEAPFTSTIDVAKATYWWLPVDFLIKDRFETIKIIDQVKVPLLIVHGGMDEITNVDQGRKLFEKAREPKTLKIIEGVNHNDLFVEPVWQMETDFIEAVMTTPATAQDPA